MSDSLILAGREFRSRLIVGTGKYPTLQVMREAHEASGADMVTVAVRRVDLKARGPENLLDHIDTKRIFILPNTAGCYTADEAVRTARLGREAGLSHWVKLEVIGDEKTLYPDTEGLLVATRILVKEGFIVLPYTSDDVVVAKKLEDAGAAAVMPLGAPIGSGLGIQNRDQHPARARGGEGARDRGRRRRHRVRRGHRHGAGRGRRAHEHRDRARRPARAHGARDAAGRRGRPRGLPGRTHRPQDVRVRLVPPIGQALIGGLPPLDERPDPSLPPLRAELTGRERD